MGNVTDCRPQAKVELPEDIACVGVECDVYEPRTIHVVTGIWYEYVRPPCVKHAFFDNPKAMRRRQGSWGRYMCADPKGLEGSTVCCDNITSTNRGEWRQELFGGERVPFGTSSDRCAAKGKRLCMDPWIEDADCSDLNQGGCDRYWVWYWTRSPCSLSVKIDLEGSIAVIHDYTAYETRECQMDRCHF